MVNVSLYACICAGTHVFSPSTKSLFDVTQFLKVPVIIATQVTGKSRQGEGPQREGIWRWEERENKER